MAAGSGAGERPEASPSAERVLDSERMLHTERVTGSPSPDRWLYVLHGIYGAGRNWRSVVSRLTDRRPDWGVLLVDLRHHGDSPRLPPPQTVEACAGDVAGLVAELSGEEEAESPPRAILGHSFGGKVALLAMELLGDGSGGKMSGGPASSGRRQAWVVDSPPGTREPGGAAVEMLRVVREHSGPFADRDEAVRALAGEGIARPVARWMTTNLERREDGAYRWRLDWDVMERLLESFFETDAWPLVESPPPGWDVRLVRATRSAALTEEDAGRVEEARRGGASVRLHDVEGGHWLNADNPDAVVELLAEELPG